jgi:hypothetical protein
MKLVSKVKRRASIDVCHSSKEAAAAWTEVWGSLLVYAEARPEVTAAMD